MTLAQVTVNDRQSIWSPVAGSTVGAFDFPIDNASELRVTRIRSAVRAVIALGADYSVSINGDLGGSITLATASVAGDVYEIDGLTPHGRISNYQQDSDWSIAAINGDLNQLIKGQQEDRRDIDSLRGVSITVEAVQAAVEAADADAQDVSEAEARIVALEASIGTTTTASIASINQAGTTIQTNLEALETQAEGHADDAALSAAAAAEAANEIPTRVFKLGNYLYAALGLAEYQKVINSDATQNATLVTNAIRQMFDEAMVFVQGGNRRSALIDWIVGTCYANNELLSDWFQEQFWLQTNLLKGKSFVVRGAGLEASRIQISTSWQSAVRNTLNGNQRTYGPWANSPSPSILFPAIAGRAPAPAVFSIRHMYMRGNRSPGKDPIPVLLMNELDADHANNEYHDFANYGELVMGSFNSSHQRFRFESCGAQPAACGSIFGNMAGWFPVGLVDFDYGGTSGVTARAMQPFTYDGVSYVENQAVPFFQPGHQFKEFVIFNGDADNGGQPLEVTLGEPIPAGTFVGSTKNVSVATGQAVNGTAGSFKPIQATTTALNAQVQLSAPWKQGVGAADMIGQLVCIPKAGSVGNPDYDMFMSRVISCDTGNDTDGYTRVTLAEAPREGISGEDFITSAAMCTVRDETVIANDLSWNVDDSSWYDISCAHSNGFGSNIVTTGYTGLYQHHGESARLDKIKIHGASGNAGMFAVDGQVIVDCSTASMQLSNFAVTHMAHSGKGSIRFMGAYQSVRMGNVEFGSWQRPADWKAVMLDPQDGYDPDQWSVIPDLNQIAVKYGIGPLYQTLRLDQGFFQYKAGLNTAQQLELRRDAALAEPVDYVTLVATDDLDDLDIPGAYGWGANSPLNAPYFPNQSILTVSIGPDGLVAQRMTDCNNHMTFERERFGGVWSVWRRPGVILDALQAAMEDEANAINTVAKHANAMTRNTTNNKIYVASGPLATDAWVSFDGTSTITPTTI